MRILEAPFKAAGAATAACGDDCLKVIFPARVLQCRPRSPTGRFPPAYVSHAKAVAQTSPIRHFLGTPWWPMMPRLGRCAAGVVDVSVVPATPRYKVTERRIAEWLREAPDSFRQVVSKQGASRRNSIRIRAQPQEWLAT